MVEPDWVKYRALEGRFEPLFHIGFDCVDISPAHSLSLGFEDVFRHNFVVVPTGTPVGRAKDAI